MSIALDTWNKLTAEQQAIVQAAADEATESGRKAQLQKEAELVSFLKDKGLDVYEPDLAAFRDQVQSMYIDSDFAKTWPEGVLDKINGLGK